MQPQESSIGPVIGTIIILAVVVLGGLYFWVHRSSNSPAASPAPAATTNQATSTPNGSQLQTEPYDVNSPMNGS